MRCSGGCAEGSQMFSEAAISVRGAGKSYRMYERPAHRLWQGLFGARRTFFREFWALQGVDLEVARGETLGVVGRNGSGKSTLLQLIAGTLAPTTGALQVQGRVAALLELGSGFNPEFTGRENVFLNAAIHGLSREETARRLDRILAFADIGEFVDQPVRSYSSGMAVRLAFAVIAHVDADVLIIDEALAVGDAYFAQKCMRFLREFRERGTLLFVSHDAGAVVALCERAVWLDDGRVRLVGTAREVVETYLAELHAAERAQVASDHLEIARTPVPVHDVDVGSAVPSADAGASDGESAMPQAHSGGLAFGAGKARIVSVRLSSEAGEPALLLRGGEMLELSIDAQVTQAVTGLIFGFYVKDRLGQRIFGDNSYLAYRVAPVHGRAGDQVGARFRFRLPVLAPGTYMVDAAVASGTQDDHTQQHWIHDALDFRVGQDVTCFGLVGVPMLEIRVDVRTPA
jgi:lipopolysaccharide transport system ATP-binding protein